jgi:hypothetical protein
LVYGISEIHAVNIKYRRESFDSSRRGEEDRARKMPLPGGLANAAAAAVWAVSTSTALLQPVDTSSSLLFQWLTCPRAVTKWLNRCIIAFLRDHRRRSLFVCDAPCLHASASRLAAFWTLVLINPASKTRKRPTRGSRCPRAVHHVTLHHAERGAWSSDTSRRQHVQHIQYSRLAWPALECGRRQRRN